MASSSAPQQSYNDANHNPSPSSVSDANHQQRQQPPNPPLEDADSDQARDSDADHDAPDDGDEHDGSSRKRKRPMSVSCELCKQRKVKCDRGQPSCGWCVRNNQLCEYKERKKPGLRAGYGRELEARLGGLNPSSAACEMLTH
ncbi:putative c6 transcription factor protein [Lasiodiplodia theobromae]|nr:putative c6 transcription factor protein [Lasiodiplodia theobromae]